MKKAYYITGISGTGKSTIASELKKYDYAVFDIDAISGLCHWKHKKTGEEAFYSTGVGKEWLEAHDWICDFERLGQLIKGQPQDAVVVGIASNQEEYLKLFDKIFLLYCSEETFIKRLNTRSDGNNFAKDNSEQQQVLSWYKDFQNRVVRLGAIPINTERLLEVVVKEIKARL